MEYKKYGENSLKALFGHDWSWLGSRYEVVKNDRVRNDGIWIKFPESIFTGTQYEMAEKFLHPTGDLDSPALPIPCTAEDFILFCKSDLVLESDIEGHYLNDDGSLDDGAFSALSIRSRPAAELLRSLLMHEVGIQLPKIFTTRPITRETAPARYDRLLLEILIGLKIDPAKIERHSGGAKGSAPKLKARVIALTSEYAKHGFTERTFQGAWERLPKLA